MMRSVVKAVGVAAVLGILAAPVPAVLHAQTGAPTGRTVPGGVERAAARVPALSGVWTRTGPSVTPKELPLNARGIALREAIDESLAPMYDCVPATTPHILGDPYNFQIDQRPDRIVIRYEKDAVVRTIWLNGPGHRTPTPADYAVQGYSTGRWDGSVLVVETSKFTFDPGGLEDKPPMVPSSTQKKVTERYALKGDRLEVEAVMEDRLIMKEPVRFAFTFERTKEPLAEWPDCDPEQSRAPLQYMPVNQLKYGPDPIVGGGKEQQR